MSAPREPDPPRSPPVGETARLVDGARDGSPERFGALYDRVAPALFAWFGVKLSAAVRRRLEPEDLMQDCWLAALQKFGDYDPAKGAFRSWMFGVAEYVVLNRLRGLARRDARVVRAADAHDSLGVSRIPLEVTTVSRRLARDEALASFVAFADALPADDRALLVACGLEGRTAREASADLGASTSAVEKRWQRLRAKLRQRAEWVDLVD